jgi:hypothetical protein
MHGEFGMRGENIEEKNDFYNCDPDGYSNFQ